MANSENNPAAPRTKRDIETRTFQFAKRVLRLVDALPEGRVGDIIGRQLGRSASSIGANTEEAQGSHSRAEFIKRMNIARSEAREAHYWLRLLSECEKIRPDRLEPLIKESDEILRILTTIVKRSRGVV